MIDADGHVVIVDFGLAQQFASPLKLRKDWKAASVHQIDKTDISDFIEILSDEEKSKKVGKYFWNLCASFQQWLDIYEFFSFRKQWCEETSFPARNWLEACNQKTNSDTIQMITMQCEISCQINEIENEKIAFFQF